MKRLFTITCFIFFEIAAHSQPTVYFDFVTHNEETSQWNNINFYTNNRTRLVNLSNYFQSNGVTWNMQSDWVYLTNVINKDTGTVTANTNNKNILMWMQDDKGVEMDPHAHESQYIYPDVVALMDSIGVTESKLIGGTIYNDSNGINIWTNLVNGQYGIIFPNKFWQPDYMMGGGTPNHVNDLKYYGFWNPQSTTNYLTHDTTSHLRHLGVGCSIRLQDTSTVAYVVSQLNDVIQNVQTGVYPANGFYLQTIFFEQADLNNMMFYNKVLQVADSVNAIIATGVAQWKTLKQAYTLWETAYNAQMFQWECGQVASGIAENNQNTFEIYPNPSKGQLAIRKRQLANSQNYEVSVFDLFGKKILNIRNQNPIDVSELTVGMYVIEVKVKVIGKETVIRSKFIKEEE